MGDPLRRHWDFEDLDATERLFRELLSTETDDPGRAEILTQLARVEGLRGDVDAGERLIEQAEAVAGGNARARVRIELELGRIRRSSGRKADALQLFEEAFEAAQDAGDDYLAGDAAHMAALSAPDRKGFLAWTNRGIEVAESNESGRYWLGPLLNNLGWEYDEAGEHEQALAAFERALATREQDPENRAAIEIARYAVGKTLRALGRPAEAAAVLEQAVAWAESVGEPDGWFHEELALSHVALGRNAEAAEHARRALALLPEADATFERDDERKNRLLALAASRDRARLT